MVQKSKQHRKVHIGSLILCPPRKRPLLTFFCTFPEFSYAKTHILPLPYSHAKELRTTDTLLYLSPFT